MENKIEKQNTEEQQTDKLLQQQQDVLFAQLAAEFKIAPKQVADTIELIDAGNTIPFIARYRKEVTGNLDDVLLRDLNARLEYLRKLSARKREVGAAISEQGKLTASLSDLLSKAQTLAEVESLYLPYKKKKRTRAMIARERGLEPLAELILAQELQDEAVCERAKSFVNADKDVATPEDALAGAQDILAEMIADDPNYRKKLGEFLRNKALLKSTVTKDNAEEHSEFENYYKYEEPVKRIADHRILALNRGEKRKVLSVKLDDLADENIAWLTKKIVKRPARQLLTAAIADSYKRLIFPSLEREIRSELKERAESSAIRNFGVNLKKLLLQPPFKNKTTLGFDPAFRTGCKLAVVDPLGKLLATDTIYPTKPKPRVKESEERLIKLLDDCQVDIIAIGNGTASRESEQFVADTLHKYKRKVEYTIVNEAGASVYSASELGAAEYPDINVSLRGAISIAGRLQDPLSELVKIDPQHIGVGQYQHDVNQKELEKVLDDTVEDAVNSIGVDINRASEPLLRHVAGVNKTIAGNIVIWREENGAFKSHADIKKVKGLGAKAFEQCAGFLRIPDGKSVLDNTGIHPESYKAAKDLLKLAGLTEADLTKDHIQETRRVLDAMNVQEAAETLEIGVPTLKDILRELRKPGRDPRDNAPKPFLKTDVLSIDDLQPDMELTGTVRNVIDFGAFVDIGVHQDGLVHISEISSSQFLRHPSEVLSIGDVVNVKVLSVDKKRNRISLSMII